MPGNKKRGGWRNPASADNGRTGGRPHIKVEFRRGERLIIERQPLAVTPETPLTRPEVGVVLSVSAGEIEVQIGNDILTLRQPDEEEE